MNDTSQVTNVGVNGSSSQASRRAFTRSTTVTRGSTRSRSCSWPRPTSTAQTRAAPHLQEAVREAARRRPDVETVLPRHRHVEPFEGVRELVPAARDEARGRLELELGALLDLRAGLVEAPDATGEDERLRLRSRLGEPTLDEQHVQPLLHCARKRTRGVGHEPVAREAGATGGKRRTESKPDRAMMQKAHGATASLEMLLRDEVEARPVVAYRLLELLARSGWHVRIERGDELRVIAEKDDVVLETRSDSLGEASVQLFVLAA